MFCILNIQDGIELVGQLRMGRAADSYLAGEVSGGAEIEPVA